MSLKEAGFAHHEKSCANCAHFEIKHFNQNPVDNAPFQAFCNHHQENMLFYGQNHYVNGLARQYICEKWKSTDS